MASKPAGLNTERTAGRYEAGTPNWSEADLEALKHGAVVSLKEARLLRDRASRQVEAGISPSKAKGEKRTAEAASA